jgi:hypothetical protein
VGCLPRRQRASHWRTSRPPGLALRLASDLALASRPRSMAARLGLLPPSSRAGVGRVRGAHLNRSRPVLRPRKGAQVWSGPPDAFRRSAERETAKAGGVLIRRARLFSNWAVRCARLGEPGPPSPLF